VSAAPNSGTTFRVAVPAGARSAGVADEAEDDVVGLDEEEHAETVKTTAARAARPDHASRPLRRTPLFRVNVTP
jgi:hypothetical protein